MLVYVEYLGEDINQLLFARYMDWSNNALGSSIHDEVALYVLFLFMKNRVGSYRQGYLLSHVTIVETMSLIPRSFISCLSHMTSQTVNAIDI